MDKNKNYQVGDVAVNSDGTSVFVCFGDIGWLNLTTGKYDKAVPDGVYYSRHISEDLRKHSPDGLVPPAPYQLRTDKNGNCTGLLGGADGKIVLSSGPSGMTTCISGGSGKIVRVCLLWLLANYPKVKMDCTPGSVHVDRENTYYFLDNFKVHRYHDISADFGQIDSLSELAALKLEYLPKLTSEFKGALGYVPPVLPAVGQIRRDASYGSTCKVLSRGSTWTVQVRIGTRDPYVHEVNTSWIMRNFPLLHTMNNTVAEVAPVKAAAAPEPVKLVPLRIGQTRRSSDSPLNLRIIRFHKTNLLIDLEARQEDGLRRYFQFTTEEKAMQQLEYIDGPSSTETDRETLQREFDYLMHQAGDREDYKQAVYCWFECHGAPHIGDIRTVHEWWTTSTYKKK